MKLFDIGSTELRCSPLFLLLFAVACVCGNGDFFALYMAAVALHEGAHWTMARLLGCSISSIKIMPYGCSAELCGLPDAFDELLIAFAGPLCSIVVFLGCRLIDNDAALEFAKANVYIAAVNLLPAYPLDGGRVLSALLTVKGKQLTRRWQGMVSAAFAVLMLGAGAYSRNITLIVFGIFMLHSALFFKKAARPPVIDHISKMKKLEAVGRLNVEHIAVSDNISLNRALSCCTGEKFTVLIVVERKSNRVYFVSCVELMELYARHGGDKLIKDIVSLTPKGIGDRINIGKNN